MKLKVMSWNIWQGKKEKDIIETIKKFNPDVVGLLEVNEDITTNTAQIIANKLGYNFAYYRTFEKNKNNEHYLQGNALLTKYKISEKNLFWLNRDIKFDGTSKTEPRAVVIVNIEVNRRHLEVAVTHLAHIHNFLKSDIQLIQAEELLNKIAKKNSILMGDFNTLPANPVIKKIEEKLLNADKLCKGSTWSVYPEGHSGCNLKGLDYRIDYIFASSDLKATAFEIIDSKASDHLPVMATFEV